MARRDDFTPVAEQVPFDPTNCDAIDKENVQGAIEDICNAVSVSASPGFSWGRSGNTSANTWLLNDSVPSNKAGRTLFISSPVITRIFTASENLDSYTIEIHEHEGDEINLTLLTTLVISSSRTGDSGTISIAATVGKQLSLRLVSGSAKNIVAGLLLSGSI